MIKAAQEVIGLYDRERHRDHAYYFGGHDSRVCAQSFYALGLWELGCPDQAERMARQCIADGRALGHAFSFAHGLNMGSLTFLLLNDVDACRAVADELYPFAERNKFPWPLAQARFLRGWVTAQQGDRDAGIEQMRQAVDNPAQTVLRPILFSFIAEQQMRAARFADAIATLDQVTDEIQARSARFHEPEIIRLRGEALLAQSRDNAAEAEAAFRQAMAVAAKQSFRAIELRAGTSLARLARRSRAQARRRASSLAPIYAAFTEGFEQARFAGGEGAARRLN